VLLQEPSRRLLLRFESLHLSLIEPRSYFSLFPVYRVLTLLAFLAEMFQKRKAEFALVPNQQFEVAQEMFSLELLIHLLDISICGVLTKQPFSLAYLCIPAMFVGLKVVEQIADSCFQLPWQTVCVIRHSLWMWRLSLYQPKHCSY
jgi:hypothetical protein